MSTPPPIAPDLTDLLLALIVKLPGGREALRQLLGQIESEQRRRAGRGATAAPADRTGTE